MAVSSDILRGHTDTIILAILYEGDNYGYEIAKRIIEAGEGYLDVKDATIYTAFRRLENDGYVTTYWGDGIEGARRKYYSATAKGKLYYEEKKREWLVVSRLLNNLILGGKK